MGWLRRRADARGSAGPGATAPAVEPDPTDTAPGTGGAAVPEAVPAADPGPQAWRTLTPPALTVQRAITTLSPVRFEAQLTTWRSPAQLRPLAHSVRADAPAGILHDLPTTVAPPAPEAPALPPLAGPAAGTASRGPTIQRFAPGPGALGPPTIAAGPPTAAPASPPPAVGADDRTTTAPERTPGPGGEPEAAADPDASSAGDERAVAVAPPAEPITIARLAAPNLPMPVVAPDVLALPIVDRAPAATPAPDRADAAAEVAPAPASATEAPTLGAESAAAEGSPPSTTPPSTPPPSTPLPGAEAPRPGLGLPLVAGAGDEGATAPTIGHGVPAAPTAGPPPIGSAPSPSPSPFAVQRSAEPAAPSAPVAGPPLGLGLPLVGGRPTGPTGPRVGPVGPDGADGGPPAELPTAPTPTPTGPGPDPSPSAAAPGPVGPVADEPAGPTTDGGDHIEVPTLGADVLASSPDPGPPPAAGDDGSGVSGTVLPLPVPATRSPIDTGPLLASAPAPPTPFVAAPPVPVAISRLAADRPTTGGPGPGPAAPAPADARTGDPARPTAVPVVEAPLVGERGPISAPRLDDDRSGSEVSPVASPDVVTPVFDAPLLPAAFVPDATGIPRAGATTAPPGPGGSSTARPVAPVPLQRLAAAPVAGGPGLHRPSGAPLARPGAGAGPSPGDVAVAAGLGAWGDDGSVVFAPPAGESWDTAGSSDGAIQRSADGHPSFPGPTSGPVPTTVTVVDTSAEPTVQLAPAGGAPGGGAGSEAELDELARRLYGRMRLQLRRELILDRERSGSLIDMPR